LSQTRMGRKHLSTGSPPAPRSVLIAEDGADS
jgi:hypothetical protein